MKIAIDYRLAGYSMRGMAKYCKNISSELLKIPEFVKNDIIFYIDDKTDLNNVPQNVKTRKLPTTNFAIGEQILLPYFLRKDKIDCFWSPHNTFPIFAPKHINMFATWHDLVVMDKRMKSNTFLSFLKRMYISSIMSCGQRKLSGIATVSEYSRRVIQDKFNFNKVVITPNCIDDFISCINNHKTNKSEDRKDFYFTVSGEMWYKNLDLLFAYFKENPDKNLKVAGLKPGSIFYKNCPENIEILPFNIPLDELIEYYKTCKAFIFVSKYEGFGIPILEAMACGCKLIVSNVTSIPEVCGNNGIYIDPYSLPDFSQAIDAINFIEIDKVSYMKQIDKYTGWEKSANEISDLILGKC